MIQAANITSWLEQPQALAHVPIKVLEEFCNCYPYFLPAAYLPELRAMAQGAAPTAALRQLQPVNPVMLAGIQRKDPDLLVTRQHDTDTSPASTHIDTLLPHESGQNAPPDYFNAEEIAAVADDAQWNATSDPTSELSTDAPDDDKSLMVVMSFAEWLRYLQRQTEKKQQEEADQRALKTMWQKQKLAAAIEEEDEEIPENVFKMAVNSISLQDDLATESLANVYLKQGKKKKAIDIYRKLSLQNPEKSAYFAKKVEQLQKDLEI